MITRVDKRVEVSAQNVSLLNNTVLSSSDVVTPCFPLSPAPRTLPYPPAALNPDDVLFPSDILTSTEECPSKTILTRTKSRLNSWSQPFVPSKNREVSLSEPKTIIASEHISESEPTSEVVIESTPALVLTSVSTPDTKTTTTTPSIESTLSPKLVESAPLPEYIESAPLLDSIESTPLPESIESAPLPESNESAPLPESNESTPLSESVELTTSTESIEPTSIEPTPPPESSLESASAPSDLTPVNATGVTPALVPTPLQRKASAANKSAAAKKSAVVKAAEALKKAQEAAKAADEAAAVAEAALTDNVTPNTNPSFASTVESLSQNENRWTLAQARKNKKVIPVIGQSDSQDLKGVAPFKKDHWDISISRLQEDSTSDKVKTFLQSKGIEVRDAFVFSSKIKGTKSARVRIAIEHKEKCKNAEIWPMHCRVSDWVFKKKNNASSS